MRHLFSDLCTPQSAMTNVNVGYSDIVTCLMVLVWWGRSPLPCVDATHGWYKLHSRQVTKQKELSVEFS